jgi:hypothetical protein
MEAASLLAASLYGIVHSAILLGIVGIGIAIDIAADADADADADACIGIVLSSKSGIEGDTHTLVMSVECFTV